MVVRGRRVSLRYARPDDAEALLELAGDPDVTRFFSWGPYKDVSEPLRFIESLDRQREEGTRLEFVVADAGDRPVGITGLSDFSIRDRRAIVGTWFGKAHWGTGANRDSKALVFHLAFGPLRLHRVSAVASPDNPRSLRALEKIGFENEGVLREWQMHPGGPQDVAILRLLRSEWESGPLAAEPVEFEGEPPPQFVATPT